MKLSNSKWRKLERLSRTEYSIEIMSSHEQRGLVAQRITRLPTEQKIPGSNPGKLVIILVIEFEYFGVP